MASRLGAFAGLLLLAVLMAGCNAQKPTKGTPGAPAAKTVTEEEVAQCLAITQPFLPSSARDKKAKRIAEPTFQRHAQELREAAGARGAKAQADAQAALQGLHKDHYGKHDTHNYDKHDNYAKYDKPSEYNHEGYQPKYEAPNYSYEQPPTADYGSYDGHSDWPPSQGITTDNDRGIYLRYNGVNTASGNIPLSSFDYLYYFAGLDMESPTGGDGVYGDWSAYGYREANIFSDDIFFAGTAANPRTIVIRGELSDLRSPNYAYYSPEQYYNANGFVPPTIRREPVTPNYCEYRGPICVGGGYGTIFSQSIEVRPDFGSVSPYELAGQAWLPKYVEIVCHMPTPPC